MRTVLLDSDGVLSDFVGGFLRVVHEVTGTRHGAEEVTGWNLFQAPFLLEHEAKAPGVVREVNALLRSPGFAASLEPYPGTREAVRALREHARVYVVSAPLSGSLTWSGEREEWLVQHFGFTRKEIVLTSAKHLVRGHVFVDDHAGNVRSWTEAHPEGHGVLWHHPYNAAEEGLRRAETWDHVLDLVRAG